MVYFHSEIITKRFNESRFIFQNSKQQQDGWRYVMAQFRLGQGKGPGEFPSIARDFVRLHANGKLSPFMPPYPQ